MIKRLLEDYGTRYVLVVVQTPEQAELLEDIITASDLDRITVIYVGQSVLGLHHRGVRPNVIVKAYTVNNDMEREWERIILRPVADRQAVWIPEKAVE